MLRRLRGSRTVPSSWPRRPSGFPTSFVPTSRSCSAGSTQASIRQRSAITSGVRAIDSGRRSTPLGSRLGSSLVLTIDSSSTSALAPPRRTLASSKAPGAPTKVRRDPRDHSIPRGVSAAQGDGWIAAGVHWFHAHLGPAESKWSQRPSPTRSPAPAVHGVSRVCERSTCNGSNCARSLSSSTLPVQRF